MHYISHYKSPLGELIIETKEGELTGLYYENGFCIQNTKAKFFEDKTIKDTKKLLDTYFSGEKAIFMPKIKLSGTDFQNEVWEELLKIDYGKTTSYGEIAKKISEKRGIGRMSARAVGWAIGKNKIAIIIPCHRVIGKDGRLTGYSGGLDKKEFLLKLENIPIKR